MNCRLTKIAFDLLSFVKREYQINRHISDDNLLALHSIFGSVLERAFEIIAKQRAVTVYSLESNFRSIIEIKGHSDKVYCLLPDVNYCSCQAFLHYVLQLRSEITCKHILAAHFAVLTDKCSKQIVSEEQFNFLYAGLYSLDGIS
ncbi:zinc finger SWIM domain-containing protein 7-like [Arctopsyche grandis]|uniref:zinc finger SWIM domain-containing protein 7-like n=1 Tax=Arctopsyche grandis TaxID=121162 RepID=UPI00406D8837